MKKDIKVSYLAGLEKTDFEDIKELGYKVDIPEKEDPKIFAYGGKPEDYIVLFTIYFSLKVADQLADRVAKKLSKNFYNVIKKLWAKHRDKKPCIIESDKEPDYKLPKAIIAFKISEDNEEYSTLELTNDINDKELKVMTKAYLDLVRLQYKNRKKENKLKKKIKK